GSNNFSVSGLVTTEENSVVLRAQPSATWIASFIYDTDTTFQIGVHPGQPEPSDAARHDAIAALDQCNGSDVWFPPSGMLTTGSSVTANEVARAISASRQSLAIAPDMMANPN